MWVRFQSVLAGFLGALTGLGGGVVVIPLLTVIFGVIRYAMGAALVSVIATSSGAAAAYVRKGYSNIRVGMFLEMATTSGALIGATLLLYLHTSAIAIIFGVVLVYFGPGLFSHGLRFKTGPEPWPDRYLASHGQHVSNQQRFRQLPRSRRAHGARKRMLFMFIGFIGISSCHCQWRMLQEIGQHENHLGAGGGCSWRGENGSEFSVSDTRRGT
jgi:uncharacterized membrane protein YfcA